MVFGLASIGLMGVQDLRLALPNDAAVFLDQLTQLSAHLLGSALLGKVDLAGPRLLDGALRRLLRRRSLLHHCTARRSTV